MATNNAINASYKEVTYSAANFSWGAFSFLATDVKLTKTGRIIVFEFPILSSGATVQNSTVLGTQGGGGIETEYRPANKVSLGGFVTLSGTVVPAKFIMNTNGTFEIQSTAGVNLSGTSLSIDVTPLLWML